jgi:hypothetical protein
MSKKDFTLENALNYHPNTSAEPIEALFTIPGEEIVILSKETADTYYLVMIHADALDPDWEHLKVSCMDEMFIPKEVLGEMMDKIKGGEN